MSWVIVVVLLAAIAAVLLLREPVRELRQRRREREQERKRQWRRDRDQAREQRRVERAMNPVKAAARKGAPRWQQVVERQGGKCWLCGTRTYADDVKRVPGGEDRPGATYPTVDYVTAIEQGGTYEWDNIRLAHRACRDRRVAMGPTAKFGTPRRTYS